MKEQIKTNVQVSEGLQRKINVEIPQTVVASTFDKVYQSIQRSVQIKGFRKGKAPIATIKSIYKNQVLGDVAQELIQSHYPQAIKDSNVEPINYPEFEFEDPTETKDFSFTAIIEVRPEVKIKKWEGLEVDREKFIFDDKKLEQSILNIRQSRAKLVDVLEDRPAQMGDTAILNFEGFVDGKPLDNGKGTDHQLELGSHQFIEGFEEGLVGLKVGEEKTIQLKFPDPYHAADIAGKPVDFKVKLNALKKKDLPELNEALIAEIGSKQTVEEFQKTLRSDIEQTETKRIEDSFKNRLIKKLVQENPVDVPASLLKEQKKALIEDFRKRMADQRMQANDFETYVKQWDSDFAKTASEMIQSSFLIDTLAVQHDLHCKKEDLDQKFAEYAKQTGLEEARVREWYSKPEQENRLTYSITEEKVLKLLTSKAKIKEVDAKDIKEEQN